MEAVATENGNEEFLARQSSSTNWKRAQQNAKDGSNHATGQAKQREEKHNNNNTTAATKNSNSNSKKKKS